MNKSSFQPGLSDLERQKLQQKMDAEIVEQREHHLTVLKKKSSIDQEEGDDSSMEMISTVVGMDEIGHQSTTTGTAELNQEGSILSRFLPKINLILVPSTNQLLQCSRHCALEQHLNAHKILRG